MIRSAARMSPRSWEMMIVVLPFISLRSACTTKWDDSGSSPVVGSSRMRIGALRTRARAMAIRCRWPPDRFVARSLSSVSYPSGIRSMNSWALARTAAATISPRVAPARP